MRFGETVGYVAFNLIDNKFLVQGNYGPDFF